MLFRMEVLEHKRLRPFGRAVPLYANDMLPIVVLLILVVLGTALWLASGTYTRTATVPGWVVPDGPAPRITPAPRGVMATGRAPCREVGWQYWEMWLVGESLKK